MSRRFELQADFQPAGDQPEAIQQLVTGLNAGEAGMTLLGVTGSGKSIGHDEPLYIVEAQGNTLLPKVVQAGPFIDALLAEANLPEAQASETQLLEAKVVGRYYTAAYDPSSGEVGLFPVSAFIRHGAPEQMFQVMTACGRQVTLTADHNLWVLRQGVLRLIKTEEVQDGDYLPLPEELPDVGALTTLNILPYLADAPLYVYAEEAILDYTTEQGLAPVVLALKASGVQPYTKLYAMRHNRRGKGVGINAFLKMLAKTEGLGGRYREGEIYVGGKSVKHRLPACLTVTQGLMRLFGYYIAEGNAQSGYLILANRHPRLRGHIESSLHELGIPFKVRASSDFQISSLALTELMACLCGHKASNKRLPTFWAALPEAALASLLRAYFDGDGTVDGKRQVSAITASQALASDLAYALLRFGIWARIRRAWKKAQNSAHRGGWYYQIAISGQRDLERFAKHIGFDHPDKQARLIGCLGRHPDSNVDRVPIAGRALSRLRKKLGLSMARVAAKSGCSRPMVSMIESGKRVPSRALLGKLLQSLRSYASERGIVDIDWLRTWQELKRLIEVRWTGISKIEQVEYPYPHVYDLSVPGPETFLAGRGGAFVHNTFTIAHVIEQLQRPTLILAPNKTLAAQLYGEMRGFFPKNAVEYFVSYYDYYQPEAYVPASDTYIEKDATINEHIEQMRLSATKALLERADAIIVATVSSIYGLGDPSEYHSMVLHLMRGATFDQRSLLRRLAELQYTRNDLELHRTTYRVRGEIIDIFPAESEREAVRVELFDDAVESLAYFDPLTGELLRRVPRLTIYPKSHYVTRRQTLLEAIEQIQLDLNTRLEELRAADKLVEAQRLEQRTRFDLEMMLEIGYCAGIENYSRYLSGRRPGEPPPTLIDYLPEQALLVVDESHVTVPQLGGMYRGDRSRKETLVEYGFRLPSALDNRPLRFDEFERLASQTIYVSATPGPYELEHSGRIVEQVVRPTGLIDPEVEVRPASTQVDDLVSEIQRRTAVHERVLVTTLTKRMAEDLTEYLSEHGIRVRYLHSDIDTVERVEILRDLRLGKFDVLVGINLLREGLDIPEVSLVAILDADKEGFLRSDRSLIQTVGRAARNIKGQAILYAGQVTGSMQRALAEMERRRHKQMEYNRVHGITPRGIKKAVADIMERAHSEGTPGPTKYRYRVAEEASEYRGLTPEIALRKIKQLEEQMYRHARDLEFEEAARLRDEIARIRAAI